MYTLSGKFQTNYLIIDRHQEKKSTLQKGIGDDHECQMNIQGQLRTTMPLILTHQSVLENITYLLQGFLPKFKSCILGCLWDSTLSSFSIIYQS